MIRPPFFLILVFTSVISVFCQSDIYDSIYAGGRQRTFMAHLPVGYEHSTANYCLILAFHGGGSPTYETIRNQSLLSPKADSAGFIVVYPEGVKVAGLRTFNAGGCCAPATTLNIDDVGFVDALIDSLAGRWRIDMTRIYATGFSNGSLLCYRLANELPNRFAAIGPVAGAFMAYPWNPAKAIPIISFHSYRDENIHYFGGITVGPSGSYYPPQDSMFQVIASGNACAVFKDTLFHDTGRYDHFLYSGCSCSAVIEQYVSYDGEHSWPGGVPIGTTSVSNQFSATDLMWDFFQNYSTACVTTGIKLQTAVRSPELLRIVPNPAGNTIRILPAEGHFFCTVFDLTGKKVMEQERGAGSRTLDLSRLPRGFYLARVIDGGQTHLCKFAKQ